MWEDICVKPLESYEPEVWSSLMYILYHIIIYYIYVSIIYKWIYIYISLVCIYVYTWLMTSYCGVFQFLDIWPFSTNVGWYFDDRPHHAGDLRRSCCSMWHLINVMAGDSSWLHSMGILVYKEFLYRSCNHVELFNLGHQVWASKCSAFNL